MPTQPQQQINGAFLAMMQNHRQGAALSDLSEAMQTVARRVLETGRPGKFALSVTIKPATRSAGALVVLDEIKLTLPKEEPKGSIFFGAEDGSLLRDNPRQLQMPLETVPGQPATVLETTGTVRMAAAQ